MSSILSSLLGDSSSSSSVAATSGVSELKAAVDLAKKKAEAKKVADYSEFSLWLGDLDALLDMAIGSGYDRFPTVSDAEVRGYVKEKLVKLPAEERAVYFAYLIQMAAISSNLKKFLSLVGSPVFAKVQSKFNLVSGGTRSSDGSIQLSLGLVNRAFPEEVHKATVKMGKKIDVVPDSLLVMQEFFHPGYLQLLDRGFLNTYGLQVAWFNALLSLKLQSNKAAGKKKITQDFLMNSAKFVNGASQRDSQFAKHSFTLAEIATVESECWTWCVSRGHATEKDKVVKFQLPEEAAQEATAEAAEKS